MDIEQLVHANIGLARKAAWAVTRNPNYTEDVQAAALLGLVEAAVSYDPALGTFSTWAWRRCYWSAIQQLRHQTQAEKWTELTEWKPQPQHDTTDDIDARLDAYDLTSRALATLTARQAELVKSVNGIGTHPQTVTEIANSTGELRQTVSARYNRALSKLRNSTPRS
jgi:RNA polymerase sigma factor (sigma-70 family)